MLKPAKLADGVDAVTTVIRGDSRFARRVEGEAMVEIEVTSVIPD